MIKITEKTTIESLSGKVIFAVDIFNSDSEKLLYKTKIDIKNAHVILKLLKISHIVEMDGQFDLQKGDLEKLAPFFEEKEVVKIKDIIKNNHNISIEIGVCQMPG